MTKKLAAEEQQIIDDIKENVRSVADQARTESEFLGTAVKEIPEIKKIFPTTQSPSGGIGFKVFLAFKLPLDGESVERTSNFLMRKKFPCQNP